MLSRHVAVMFIAGRRRDGQLSPGTSTGAPMSKPSSKNEKRPARPLGRLAARELSPQDLAAVRGGVINTTHATGPHGDDPSDPDDGI
jgi:hypothetical protein